MWILFLILMTGIVQADVYVITAPDKSVYSLSEADDAVLPDGYKKDIIENKTISDLTITPGEEKLYDFNGSKFTPNAKKIQDKNKAEEEAILRAEKAAEDKASVITKLKTLNFTDAEILLIIK